MQIRQTILVVCALFVCTAGNAQIQSKSAEVVLSSACKQAAAENKKVFVIFHASWCKWCHKLDTAMSDASCKKLFDDNYVICHLTVWESKENLALENPGALELLKKYGGSEQGGIPFWLIFDDNGKLIGDSKIRPEGALPGEPWPTIGYPASTAEMAAFKQVLRATSKLTDVQLDIIGERLLALKGN